MNEEYWVVHDARVVYEVLREEYGVGMVEAALVEDILEGAGRQLVKSGHKVRCYCEQGGAHAILNVDGRERKIAVQQ